MARDYDDGLPEAIQKMIDARFDLMLVGQALDINHNDNSNQYHRREHNNQSVSKDLSREEFIYEYQTSRKWTGKADDLACSIDSPTVEILFEEAVTTLKRNIEDEDFG